MLHIFPVGLIHLALRRARIARIARRPIAGAYIVGLARSRLNVKPKAGLHVKHKQNIALELILQAFRRQKAVKSLAFCLREGP